MTGPPLERVLRRDRAVVLAVLAAIILLAWLYLAWFGGRTMADMPGMAAEAGPAGAISAIAFAPWSPAEFLVMFLMWAAMMVGMMTPSVAPMLLIYARVARQAGERGQPFAATGWFASGYLLAWIAFAAAATVLQGAFEQAALLTPAMASADRLFGASLLIAAGLYQWTRLKQACLAQCQSPFQFIQRHGGFRRDGWGSIMLGAKHGAYCVGCCWALMLLLFFGGVMNFLWIAALAVLALAEKLTPHGRLLSRTAGAAFLLAGVALALGGT